MRQAQALTIMMRGENVFLTGAPGSGKTYVLQQFINQAQSVGRRIAVTASTGIAASHLGGTTIHSWSGLGVLNELTPAELDRLGGSDKLIKRYNSADILVIDEVSMLHGTRLDMVDTLAKILRGSDKPFGGLQVILVGDLFQLPPVSPGEFIEDFVHFSKSWEELGLHVCYLTEQHRQEASDELLDLLEAMRRDDLRRSHGDLIMSRLGRQPEPGQVVTRLYSHNFDVDTLNQQQLSALTTETRTYTMQTKGSKAKLEQLMRGLLVPEELTLRIGAEVMFVANNFAEGFVNGSRGRVMDFKYGLPVVELVNGRQITVDFHSWSLSEDGKVRAEVSQLPLRLAWAITIHKSQGMSLDAAEIDLARAFTPGMGYVALSRVRSIEGLYLKGINRVALTMHPHMGEFDARLRAYSNMLSEDTDDYIAPDPGETTGPAISNVDPKLFELLRQWRSERAKADRVAPFMVAHNKTLEALASSAPQNQQQLLGVPGFGPKKVELYGQDILSITAAHDKP